MSTHFTLSVGSKKGSTVDCTVQFTELTELIRESYALIEQLHLLLLPLLAFISVAPLSICPLTTNFRAALEAFQYDDVNTVPAALLQVAVQVWLV